MSCPSKFYYFFRILERLTLSSSSNYVVSSPRTLQRVAKMFLYCACAVGNKLPCHIQIGKPVNETEQSLKRPIGSYSLLANISTITRLP